MREQFLFAKGYLPLNHGSYGTYPRSVHAAKMHWQEVAEQRPDWFMRKKYMGELNKCRRLAARAINASVSDCVFVMNATTGINEILRSLPWKTGDTILYYSTVYGGHLGYWTELGSCEKTVQYLCDTIRGFKSLKLELDYPISDEQILGLTTSTFEKNSSIKLVLMDALSSLPGVIFPWERVCHLCRHRNVYSLVDGAHAITQVTVDIAESQPDFFVSNLHKWSYVPRGCALLYVRSSLQQLIHSIPIGHGYISSTQPFVPSPVNTNPEGQWVTEHEWIGTIDWSGYLSVVAAFEFIDQCGGPRRIRDYCRNLAVKGGQAVADILGTEILGIEGSDYIANMVNVKLPLSVPDESSPTHIEELAAQRQALLDRLLERDCFPYPFVMTSRGRKQWWCRFSAQIYLDLDDFRQGAMVLKEVCENLRCCDFSAVVDQQKEEATVKQLENLADDPEARLE